MWTQLTTLPHADLTQKVTKQELTILPHQLISLGKLGRHICNEKVAQALPTWGEFVTQNLHFLHEFLHMWWYEHWSYQNS